MSDNNFFRINDQLEARETLSKEDLEFYLSVCNKYPFKTAVTWGSVEEANRQMFHLFEKTDYPAKKLNPIKDMYSDKSVESLMFPFVSKDELRPNMQCISFEDEYIVATNGFGIAMLPNKTNKRGLYKVNRLFKEFSTDVLIKAEADAYKFPHWPQVMPLDSPIKIQVDFNKLYSRLYWWNSLKIYASSGKYNVVMFNFNDITIVFNGKYLLDVVTFLLKTGNRTGVLELSDANRAALFVGAYSKVLLMPVMKPDDVDVLIADMSKYVQSDASDGQHSNSFTII